MRGYRSLISSLNFVWNFEIFYIVVVALGQYADNEIITSLLQWFSNENQAPLSISLLHPKKYTSNEFKDKIKLINRHCQIENIIEEFDICYQH